MAGVHPNFDPSHLYFVTTTTARHGPIFQRDRIRQILVNALDYQYKNGKMVLYCFVIMPNHIHFIARFSEKYPLPDAIRDYKKYTAKQIIQHYQKENNLSALSWLRQAASVNKDQHYKVWEDDYDARDVFSPDFLRQKVEYIHNNPCQERWQLVARPEDYRWSSACFYLAGKPAIIHVEDLRELLVL